MVLNSCLWCYKNKSLWIDSFRFFLILIKELESSSDWFFDKCWYWSKNKNFKINGFRVIFILVQNLESLNKCFWILRPTLNKCSQQNGATNPVQLSLDSILPFASQLGRVSPLPLKYVAEQCILQNKCKTEPRRATGSKC